MAQLLALLETFYDNEFLCTKPISLSNQYTTLPTVRNETNILKERGQYCLHDHELQELYAILSTPKKGTNATNATNEITKSFGILRERPLRKYYVNTPLPMTHDTILHCPSSTEQTTR